MTLPPHKLGLIAALAFSAGVALADSSDETPELETIEVVADQRVDKPVSTIPGAVTVIEGEKLREQLDIQHDVEAALRQLVAGYNDNDFPSIRGRRALVLINGTPQNETLRESSGFEIENIDPAAIERIEVIRGATALYGYGAPGGVINIVTKAATSAELKQQTQVKLRANPKAAGPSFESRLYHSASQVKDDLDYHFGISAAREKLGFDHRGERIPDYTGDTKDYGFDTTLGYRLDDAQKLGFQGGYRRRDLVKSWSEQGGTFSGTPGTAQHDAFADNGFIEDWHVNLSYENREIFRNTSWRTEFFRQFHYDTENQDLGYIAPGLIGDDRLTNDSWGVRNTLDSRLQLWRLTYGLDFVRDGFRRPAIDVSNGQLIRWFAPPVKLDTWAVFLQVERPLGEQWLLNLGARHERYQGRTEDTSGDVSGITGGKTDVESVTLGNIGLVYFISEGSEVFGAISQGTDITQLGRAAQQASQVEQIELQPDPSTQYEIGWRKRNPRYTLEASAFYTRSDKGVTLVPNPVDPNNLPLVPVREPRQTAGVELLGEYVFNLQWRTGVLVSLQEGKVDTGNDGSYQYQSAADISPPRINTWATYKRGNLSHRLQLSARLPRDRFEESSTAFGEGNTDEEYIVDYLLSAKLGKDDLVFAINNVLDEDELTQTSQAYQGDFYVRKIDGRYVSLTYRKSW